MDLHPEEQLCNKDSMIAEIIRREETRWPMRPSEDPIWGLLRMVLAQQISTRIACQMAAHLKLAYPEIATPSPAIIIDLSYLRSLGLPERRAECCLTILRKSDEIRQSVREGKSWEDALAGIKGIGPWTLAVFRIMVLREPDELPKGDVGLVRAIKTVYGPDADVELLGENWRPFRSVACWYLWKTLGNEQLG
jgi:DNA-3-methyladenine glycosylase II